MPYSPERDPRPLLIIYLAGLHTNAWQFKTTPWTTTMEMSEWEACCSQHHQAHGERIINWSPSQQCKYYLLRRTCVLILS